MSLTSGIEEQKFREQTSHDLSYLTVLNRTRMPTTFLNSALQSRPLNSVGTKLLGYLKKLPFFLTTILDKLSIDVLYILELGKYLQVLIRDQSIDSFVLFKYKPKDQN